MVVSLFDVRNKTHVLASETRRQAEPASYYALHIVRSAECCFFEDCAAVAARTLSLGEVSDNGGFTSTGALKPTNTGTEFSSKALVDGVSSLGKGFLTIYGLRQSVVIPCWIWAAALSLCLDIVLKGKRGLQFVARLSRGVLCKHLHFIVLRHRFHKPSYPTCKRVPGPDLHVRIGPQSPGTILWVFSHVL